MLLREELRDILISILLITLIFIWPNVLSLEGWLISFLVVVVAFFFHELAHRAMARNLGFVAFYRMFPQGLLLSLLLTILSWGHFKFIMPGAVIIYPIIGLWGGRVYPSRREAGLISLAGPTTNLGVALICLALLNLFAFPHLLTKILLGLLSVNVWLAFFNLIPFGMLDGQKILRWDLRIWLAAICIAGFLLFWI
jgi:Zn-dependent protease